MFPGGFSTFKYPYTDKEMNDVSKIILSKSEASCIKFVLPQEYVVTKKNESVSVLYSRLLMTSCGSSEWSNVVNRLEESLLHNLNCSELIKYLDIVDDCGEFLKQALDENYEKIEDVLINRHLSYGSAKTWYLKNQTKIKLKCIMINTFNSFNTEAHQELYQYIAGCLNVKYSDFKLVMPNQTTVQTIHNIDLESLLEEGHYDYVSNLIVNWFNKYS